MRLFFFITSKTQNIWCVAHFVVCVLGYSISEKIQKGVEDTLCWPPPLPPWNFSIFPLPLEIPDKTKLSLWIFHRIVLDSLEIQGQKQTPGISTKGGGEYENAIAVTLWNSILFLIKPWKFYMLFLWYSSKFHILKPPSLCLDFFWNSSLQGLREEKSE